jgi:arachidonate 15-lipoxygenase
MTAFLPQFDPRPGPRDRRLGRARRRFCFCHTHISPLAVIDRLPARQQFPTVWVQRTARQVLVSLQNQLQIRRDARLARRLRVLERLLARAGAGAVGLRLRLFVADTLRFRGDVHRPARRPEQLEEYAQLFRTIGLPPIARDFQEDAVFAWMRLAGPNPTSLQGVARLDDRFPVSEAIFQSVLPGDSLEAAGKEGRLFLADYAALAGVECGTFPHGQKYIYAPLALFAVDRQSQKFRPVAIQCEQAPGPDAPIFTPHDGVNWLLAKTVVEVADGNLHEMVAHLARTHLLMEPFVVCTHRQLARNHPLNRLLALPAMRQAGRLTLRLNRLR